MLKKKISIILSTFNESAAIEKTVDEIIKYIPDVEVVIVDDGCPEKSGLLAKRITKKAQGVGIWQPKGYFQEVLRARLTLGSAWLKWYLSCSERSQ